MSPQAASYTNIDEYINNFAPPQSHDFLKNVRKLVKSTTPKAEEAISYGIPAFKLNGRALIYFAGYKNHVSIYPIPDGSQKFLDKI